MKSPLAYVTGIAGFAGSYLAEELLAHGWRVAGSVYDTEALDNLSGIESKLQLERLDILNPDRIREHLQAINPDYIFHLAALASVGRSFEMERATYRVNFEGTVNLLQGARSCAGLKKLVMVSSADAYGVFRPAAKLLTETQPLNPISPYGIAKAAAEQTALYYFRQFGLPVCIARAFNHSGPRQRDDFVIPSFAKQIAQIEKGKQEPVIHVGDLTARRDLSDVRDIVRGYRLVAEKGKPGQVYQLCSGRSVAIKQVLQTLLNQSSAKIKVATDPTRFRKSDIPVLRGSSRKAGRELGWTLRYTLKTTLSDTLNWWRQTEA
ncbi:MAG: GDP-mannose 4,6-dehydratase [candidate division Zixibacteria bacterium]|nr:GDP-mannose 4,6-dehydratase [candidate division Zixibacteria bacterium]